jgi:hypothetical protein
MARRRLAPTLVGVRSLRRLVELTLPFVGLVFVRPGTPPLGQWMAQLLPPSTPARMVIGSTPGGQRAVVHLVSSSMTLLRAAKIPLSAPGLASLEHEAAALRQQRGAVEAAGAHVPEGELVRLGAGRSALVQQPLAGMPAALLLTSGRQPFGSVASTLTDWLQRWNRETATTTKLDMAFWKREVLRPAALVAPFLTRGAELVEDLAVRCSALSDVTLPLVAGHNDLTMWNVLLDGAGSLGILDWEAAQADALPLMDFYYAIADAAAAVERYTDRRRSVEQCFGSTGQHRALVASLEKRLRTSLGLSEAAAALSFDACWIQHAANDVARHGSDASRPFLKIIEGRANHLGSGAPGRWSRDLA